MRRTKDQNSLMWSLLDQVSEQAEWHGDKLSSEDWKDIFTAALRVEQRRARVVPGIGGGHVVMLGMRTSKMTKEELGDLLEMIHAFAAERGVQFREYQGE